MADDIGAIARVFTQEVPEIASGSIEIKAIARKSGYRSKVAVQSHDPTLDCIEACVGVRGRRINNIVDALGGERIDLVRWSDSPEQLIANALQPAQVDRIAVFPGERRAVVFVKLDEVSLVLGRGGETLWLASELSGWKIDVEGQ